MTNAEKVVQGILDDPLTGREFSLLMLAIMRVVLRRPGIHIDDLTDEVYRGVMNGGPENGKTVMTVTLVALRKRLRRYGVTITSPTGRGNSRYHIEEISDAEGTERGKENDKGRGRSAAPH